MEVLLVVLGVIVLLFFIALVWDGYQRDNYQPPTPTGPPRPVSRGSTYLDERGRTRCMACRKVVFFTEDTANVASNRAWTRRNKYLRPYYEMRCHYWHLSSRLPRVYV